MTKSYTYEKEKVNQKGFSSSWKWKTDKKAKEKIHKDKKNNSTKIDQLIFVKGKSWQVMKYKFIKKTCYPCRLRRKFYILYVYL